jgi:hypothetical protein
MINNEKNLKRRRRRTNKTMSRLKLSNETKTSLIALALIAITALANIGPSAIALADAFGLIQIPNPTLALESAGVLGSIGVGLCAVFCPMAASSSSAATIAAAGAILSASALCTLGVSLAIVGAIVA